MIPFYGAEHPDLFAIERSAMDRSGLVIAALDRVLPNRGVVGDIGAGNGFTARKLTTSQRRVIAVEPSAGMIREPAGLPWVRALAQHLPFRPHSLDGLYATWAYFFPRFMDVEPGLLEANRVLQPGSPLAIVDNLGDDEATAPGGSDIATEPGFWLGRGFHMAEIQTAFEFDSMNDARRLMGFYFGDEGRDKAQITMSFRVGLFTKEMPADQP